MNLLDRISKATPEGKKTRCHSRPPAGRLQYRPFIPPLMWKDRICHKSDCPIFGTLSWYASELCWHFSRWVSELKLNTAAPSPDYCRRQQWDSVLTQSAFPASGPWADQIKCFITPQSIQSLLHFLSLRLIWHLYLFSDSIHPLGATFYCPYSCSSQTQTPTSDRGVCYWENCITFERVCMHITLQIRLLCIIKVEAVGLGSERLNILNHWRRWCMIFYKNEIWGRAAAGWEK